MKACRNETPDREVVGDERKDLDGQGALYVFSLLCFLQAPWALDISDKALPDVRQAGNL